MASFSSRVLRLQVPVHSALFRIFEFEVLGYMDGEMGFEGRVVEVVCDVLEAVGAG